MKRWLGAGLAVAAVVWTAAPAAAGDAYAKIESAEANGRMDVQAIAHLPAGVEGRYELEVRKSGPGGVSRTRQSGRVPAGGGSGPLSRTSFNLGAGDILEATLTVFPNGGEPLKDVLSVGR